MKQLSRRSAARFVAAAGIPALALLAVVAPQASAKRAPQTSDKRVAQPVEARLIDRKQDHAGPAFERQWEMFRNGIASKRSADKAPMFGDSDVFVRFSAMTGAPRLVFGDLGELPAAAKAGDRAMLWLQANSSVFGIDTADLTLARAFEGAVKPEHFYYTQQYQGLPVFNAEVGVHVDQKGHVWAVNNTYYPVSAKSTTPAVTAEGALGAAAKAVRTTVDGLDTTHAAAPELGVWPTTDGGVLAWRVLADVRGVGLYEVIVDAATGETVEPARALDCNATGTGKVEAPNAVVALNNDALRDTTNPFPETAYVTASLPYLNDGGNTALVGTYAQVPTDQTGGRITRANLDFSDLRRSRTASTAQWNQVNAYWAINFAQDAFQGLGYTAANGSPVMNYSLQYYAHQSPHEGTQDNSHFDPDNRSGTGTGHLCFGTGGVDDAEDIEIVWHEFGHAMLTNQRPGTNQNVNSEGVGEGTGDALAGILSKKLPGALSYHATVGEWDATSYRPNEQPHPNLRTLTNPTFWENRPVEVHDAGEIWSHPVFDYNEQVGTDTGLDVMLQAQFLYDLTPTQVECANAFITADMMLNGGATTGQIKNAFFERHTLSGTVHPIVHTPGIGVQATGTFFLRNSSTPGGADITVGFGSSALTQIVGDWNGNGSDTIGGYDPTNGNFFLKNTNAPGGADLAFSFGGGGAGIVPVVGDWDGNGTETVGLYNTTNGTFFLKNTNAPGGADLAFQFGGGGATVIPVVGDWDGNGTDTVGLYNSATGVFFLKNSNSAGGADLVFQFGAGGADITPVAGDWDGSGADSVGFYVGGTATFFLKNTNASGASDYTFSYGAPNAKPLSGDWNGGMHPFSDIG